MRVTHLDIDPRHTAALADAGLSTTVDLLLLSTPEIARRASLSLTAARAAKVAAAATEFPRGAITAQELLASREHHTARLTTGCPALDASLQGGILGRGITEVVGESAAAKTQFCLQLAVTVQLPLSAGGLAGAAVYICTEDAFPNKRMVRLCERSVDLASRCQRLTLPCRPLWRASPRCMWTSSNVRLAGFLLGCVLCANLPTWWQT